MTQQSLSWLCGLLMFYSIGLLATPNRPVPKEEIKKVLKLVGPTNWGDFYQDGNAVALDNHPHWYAVGRIRPDGKVEILWTLRSINQPAQGLYEIGDTGDLTGHWGYDCTIASDGSLTGTRYSDHIFPVKPKSD